MPLDRQQNRKIQRSRYQKNHPDPQHYVLNQIEQYQKYRKINAAYTY
jgi:hypothetical protein